MYTAVVLMPLLGAIISGLFGPWVKDRGSQIVSCVAVGLSALMSLPIFYQVALNGQSRTIELFVGCTGNR